MHQDPEEERNTVHLKSGKLCGTGTEETGDKTGEAGSS